MAKIKQEKLAVDIQRYISEIIQFEMGHINVGMVTVTKVKVSDDNSWAKVYVSFLDKDREKKLEALKNAKWLIRSELAKRLTIRKTPDINFVLDDSYQKGEHIEEIIKEIKRKESSKE
jgi:ribosome-binding factor A